MVAGSRLAGRRDLSGDRPTQAVTADARARLYDSCADPETLLLPAGGKRKERAPRGGPHAQHQARPDRPPILAELQADGRMTNVELSRRVGISAPPCLRRVRTLEEAGLIQGYHARINARELGFEVQVFAMVGLSSQAERDLSAFEAKCRAAGRWCASATC